MSTDSISTLHMTIGEKMYLSDKFADVRFVFEKDGGEQLPAHKGFLATGSKVFETMFNGSWIEKDKVDIVDTSASAFKEFLQFFYVKQVKLTMGNVAKVMNLGNQYDVAECLKGCDKLLKSQLTADNVFWVYGLAILHERKELISFCDILISGNSKAVLNSAYFLECHQEVLAHILKLDYLDCLEVELFEASMAWVKATSKQDIITKELVETHLGAAFRDIRFGSMTLQEFSYLIPAYRNAFSNEEYKEFIQLSASEQFKPKIFNKNREKRLNPIILFGFRCDRRLFGFDKTYKIKYLEVTKFSINETMFLASIGCNPIFECRNNQSITFRSTPIHITILEFSDSENSDGKVVLNEQNITVLGCCFPQKILIRAGFMYEIRLEINAAEHLYTKSALKSKVHIESDIIVQFHGESAKPNDDPVMHGLVHYMRFMKDFNRYI